VRFIHTADIHLDSPLHGLTAYPDAPVELLRSATRDAFSSLIDIAIEERVDFVIIAGDLYDGTWRDHNTGIFFCKEMGRLKRADIPTFLLYGNHDAESEMTKKLQLPDNVHCFSAREAQTFTLDDLKVALHGRSFKEKETTENLVTTYPRPIEGFFNIGVLHTALEGNSMHASYAPCSVAELHSKGYHYWALGHVHDYSIWRGDSTIVFPGNLQGRNIRETGRRGAVLVSVEDGFSVTITRLYVDVLQWHVLNVDVSDCAGLLDVVRKIGNALNIFVTENNRVPCAIRVVIMGRSMAHGELFGLESQLRMEVLSYVAAIGNEHLWVEKVKIETEPLIDNAQIESRMDAIADMHHLLMEAETDDALLKDLQGLFAPFVAKVPLELISSVPFLQAIRAGDLTSIVQHVRPGLLSHLSKAE